MTVTGGLVIECVSKGENKSVCWYAPAEKRVVSRSKGRRVAAGPAAVVGADAAIGRGRRGEVTRSTAPAEAKRTLLLERRSTPEHLHAPLARRAATNIHTGERRAAAEPPRRRYRHHAEPARSRPPKCSGGRTRACQFRFPYVLPQTHTGHTPKQFYQVQFYLTKNFRYF